MIAPVVISVYEDKSLTFRNTKHHQLLFFWKSRRCWKRIRHTPNKTKVVTVTVHKYKKLQKLRCQIWTQQTLSSHCVWSKVLLVLWDSLLPPINNTPNITRKTSPFEKWRGDENRLHPLTRENRNGAEQLRAALRKSTAQKHTVEEAVKHFAKETNS